MAATASVFCRSVFLKRKGVCVSVLRRVGKILVEHISQIMILVVGHWCLFSGMKICMSKRYGQHLLMCVNMHMSVCMWRSEGQHAWLSYRLLQCGSRD